MNFSSTLKKLFIAATFIALVVGVFLIYALAGLNSSPVTYAEPPAFVESYGAKMAHSDPTYQSAELKIDKGQLATSQFSKLTGGLSVTEKLVFNVILGGNSSEVLTRLFAHPDKTQRIKVASAFAAVNVRFSHNEETGFADKRRQFWLDVEQHIPDIQNGLSEALISSAKAGKYSYTPYTLAWLPEQGRETVELFTWAAKHHPNASVRRSSLYYVVILGGNEDLAGPLLQNKTHDPDYKTRKEALELRYKRFTGQI